MHLIVCLRSLTADPLDSIQLSEEPIDRPDLVVHADWGSDPKKRWMCVATRDWHDRFDVGAPELVGRLDTFWRRLTARSPGPRIVAGFDFPLGIPQQYASRAGLSSFREALSVFGSGPWSDFYQLATSPSEISLHRPFFPYRPGGTKQIHLLDGLGVSDVSQLLRRCERATSTRGPASPLFWTLGGKQVGRAAIVGWQGVIMPGLADHDLRLWPFDGDLQTLLANEGPIALETYPAEACLHIGSTPPGKKWSKTSQDGRRNQSEIFLQWADGRGIRLASSLRQLISDGFGPSKHAEDPFDATVGLFSMLEVALGHRAEGAPDDAPVRQVEGWILGQSDDSPLRLAV